MYSICRNKMLEYCYRVSEEIRLFILFSNSPSRPSWQNCLQSIYVFALASLVPIKCKPRSFHRTFGGKTGIMKVNSRNFAHWQSSRNLNICLFSFLQVLECLLLTLSSGLIISVTCSERAGKLCKLLQNFTAFSPKLAKKRTKKIFITF